MLLLLDPDNSQLLGQLESAIRELPDASVHLRETEAQRNDCECDAVLTIEVAGKPTTLLIEAKKSIFPRDVREAIWRIRHYVSTFPRSAGASQPVPIIAATSISEGAKELLRLERIGYFKEGGSLFLPGGDGPYVFLDRPRSKAASRTNRALFSGKRSQVVHALLKKPNQWLGVKGLAQEALVSSATASQVLTELDKFDWLSSQGSGPHKERKLVEPRALLDAWAKQQSASLAKPSIRRFYVPSVKTDELLVRIDEVCSTLNSAYAITGEWAAQLYSPFISNISQVHCRLPANQPISEFATQMNAREVREGSNLGIVETKSQGDFLFRERERNVWLASPILVYLNLLQSDGRAKEMAEHLRLEGIRF